jgi:hypothetical protein
MYSMAIFTKDKAKQMYDTKRNSFPHNYADADR